VSKAKVSFCNRISKWMDKKELGFMTEGLGKEGKDWQYKTRKNRCAVYVREMEKEEVEKFNMPHWFMWKWATARFCRS